VPRVQADRRASLIPVLPLQHRAGGFQNLQRHHVRHPVKRTRPSTLKKCVDPCCTTGFPHRNGDWCETATSSLIHGCSQ